MAGCGLTRWIIALIGVIVLVIIIIVGFQTSCSNQSTPLPDGTGSSPGGSPASSQNTGGSGTSGNLSGGSS